MVDHLNAIKRYNSRQIHGDEDNSRTPSDIRIRAGERVKIINQYLHSGPFHPYLYDESICNFRGVWCIFFIFILFHIEISVTKQ